MEQSFIGRVRGAFWRALFRPSETNIHIHFLSLFSPAGGDDANRGDAFVEQSLEFAIGLEFLRLGAKNKRIEQDAAREEEEGRNLSEEEGRKLSCGCGGEEEECMG